MRRNFRRHGSFSNLIVIYEDIIHFVREGKEKWQFYRNISKKTCGVCVCYNILILTSISGLQSCLHFLDLRFFSQHFPGVGFHASFVIYHVPGKKLEIKTFKDFVVSSLTTHFLEASNSARILLSSLLISCLAWISDCKLACKFKISILSSF